MSWFNTIATETTSPNTAALTRVAERHNDNLILEQFLESEVVKRLAIEEQEYKEFLGWKRQSVAERLNRSIANNKLNTIEPFLFGAYASADFLHSGKRITFEMLKNRLLNFVQNITPESAYLQPNKLGLILRDTYLLSHYSKIDKKFDNLFVSEFCKNLSIEANSLNGGTIDVKLDENPAQLVTLTEEAPETKSKSKNKKRRYFHHNSNNTRKNKKS